MAGLAGIYELEGAGEGRFRGAPTNEGGARVYGGHTLSQALLGCFETIAAGWSCYLLHAQFTRIGSPDLPIDHDIRALSDSRTMAVRHVVAAQAGRVIMTMTASFQSPQAGLDFQAVTAPDAPSPDGLRSEGERYGEAAIRLAAEGRTFQHLPTGIDARWVDPQDFFAPVVKPAENRVWVRATEPIGDSLRDRQIALAYCSDFAFFETATRPHAMSFASPPNLLAGSLDHSIWFHRPADMRDWHMSHSLCVSTHGGCGFVRGELFDPAGVCVASLAQEGVLRLT